MRDVVALLSAVCQIVTGLWGLWYLMILVWTDKCPGCGCRRQEFEGKS